MATTATKQKRRKKSVNIDSGKLAALCSMTAVSGRESILSQYIFDELEPYVDDIAMDEYGNIIAVRVGEGEPLMFEAHMDEVGFMVQYVGENGFIKFLPVGPIMEAPVTGQRMVIQTKSGDLKAIVGYSHGCGKTPTYSEMFLDTGYDAEYLQSVVRLGDVVTFDVAPRRIGDDKFSAKALDNRCGVFILMQLAEWMSQMDPLRSVAFCFSVRHEVGALGIPALVNRLHPAMAVVLDVALASDYPHGSSGRIGSCRLGGGPVLWRGVDISERMHQRLGRLSEMKEIRSQRSAWNVFTPTNASHVLKAAAAVETTLISIPHRYPHGPCSMVCLRDIEGVLELLKVAVCDEDFMKVADAD